MRRAVRLPTATGVLRLSLPLPLIAAVGLTAVSGCSDDSLQFTETKRIDEKVTVAELRTFLRIVESLPGEKLPELSAVFAPPPDWEQSRTLPVRDLVAEEQARLDERWTTGWLVRHMERGRPLELALRRERMTPEQFVSLTLAIGVALARSHAPDQQELDELVRKGELELQRLRQDERPFASLRPDNMYYVLQQAVWITRVNRAEHLRQVPPENIALVRAHREKLESIFPQEFTRDPLAEVADLKEKKGLPFEELSVSGRDVEIEWRSGEAIIGRDLPDPEFREETSDDRGERIEDRG